MVEDSRSKVIIATHSEQEKFFYYINYPSLATTYPLYGAVEIRKMQELHSISITLSLETVKQLTEKAKKVNVNVLQGAIPRCIVS